MQKSCSENSKSSSRGLIIVFTGNGKGKTTAALGTALRAAGYGMRTLVLQFIKNQESGEHKACHLLHPFLEIVRCGAGFVVEGKGDFQIHVEAARKGLNLAREKITSGQYEIVILDEIFVALSLGLINLEDLLLLISLKPESLHLILTGRDAPQEIIEIADTVSEIKEIKHAFRFGVTAQKGIEF
ncbi:MAG: cob(I)yrinic acid a,c-diamide adenosyltransferase [bacterium]